RRRFSSPPHRLPILDLPPTGTVADRASFRSQEHDDPITFQCGGMPHARGRRLGPPPGCVVVSPEATTIRVAVAAGAASSVLTRDPLALLASARRHGAGLTLHAELEPLAGIRSWLETCPDLRRLEPRSVRRLELALYELCANVVEHGYRLQPCHTFELWWVPGQDRQASSEVTEGGAELLPPGECFLLRDCATPFEPARPLCVDFGDPNVRRKR